MEEIHVDSMVYNDKSVIVRNDGIYKIDILTDDMTEFDDNIAYIKDGYYYLYRGSANPDNLIGKKPGIYRNTKDSKTNPIIIIDPDTQEEKNEYSALLNVVNLHPVSIIDQAQNKEEILIAIPECTKIFQPPISETDDILKLVMKKVLMKKNIDLDKYKDRFNNKNSLFNFKQVLRGDGQLSRKIFDRGIEALNLEYIIMVKERTTNDVVGDMLMEPVVVSSEDTYAA